MVPDPYFQTVNIQIKQLIYGLKKLRMLIYGLIKLRIRKLKI
jgi:hypothetical protein